MEAEERVPGITFWVESAKELPSTENIAAGRVVLTATINDLEMWDDCKKKLDGLRIYGVANFADEIMDVLREDNRAMESKLEHKETVESALRHEISLREKEIARLQSFISKQNAVMTQQKEELEGLRQLKQELDALLTI